MIWLFLAWKQNQDRIAGPSIIILPAISRTHHFINQAIDVRIGWTKPPATLSVHPPIHQIQNNPLKCCIFQSHQQIVTPIKSCIWPLCWHSICTNCLCFIITCFTCLLGCIYLIFKTHQSTRKLGPTPPIKTNPQFCSTISSCSDEMLGQEILVAGYFLLKNRYCRLFFMNQQSWANRYCWHC